MLSCPRRNHRDRACLLGANPWRLKYTFRGLSDAAGVASAGAAVNTAAPAPPARSKKRRAAAAQATGGDLAMMISNPLGMGNWQLMPRTALALNNKTV